MAYTPTCPPELREAFDKAPVMVRARAARARLAANVRPSAYDRATDLLGKIDEVIGEAEAQWPIITGPYPHLSDLHCWLAHWGAAVEAACWRERTQVAA